MQKLAITTLAAALSMSLAARSADACNCGPDCLPWLNPVAYAMGVGMVGAYGYGVGYFAVNDLRGGEHSTNYYGSELVLHGSFGGVFLGATIDAARHGNTGAMVAAGSFAAMHLTLATNGLRGLVAHSGEFHPNDTMVTWGVGTLTGINALVWSAGMSERHGRGYGIAEAAINAPFVAGFASLAKDRFDTGASGPGIAYAGLAALSGLYVAHGLKTALLPYHEAKLDLLGTELAPTVVSTGHGDVAPGLATSGTF